MFARLVLLLIVASSARSAFCQDAQSEFYKGYYLQNEMRDVEAAVQAYGQALELDASPEIRQAIEKQTAILREDLATTDFASIMPANAMAYVELSRPAEHIESLLEIMGLTGAEENSHGNETISIKLDDGMILSSDFQVSPALLRELKKIRGAAASISEIDEDGEPVGLVVIHPGTSDLVRGIIETAVQLVPSNDQIAGYPTFRIEDEVWVVKTERLILVSPAKSQIEAALSQLADSAQPSLASQEAFQTARSENRAAVFFAFADTHQAVERFGNLMRDEAAIARVVLDLDHLQSLTAAVSTTDQGLRVRLHAGMDEDHKSLAYGLIRTVPLSHEALQHVPAGAALVAGIGMNPKLLPAAAMVGSVTGRQHLTALDIGREIFANIQEVGFFILPSVIEANDEVPNFGLVIASNDADKSAALWNQLLSLPAELHVDDGPAIQEIEIAGTAARKYSFPDEDAPELIVARLGEKSLIAGTAEAVTAAIQASVSDETIANDPPAKALWEHANEHTSKAVFMHLGRLMGLASTIEDGSEAEHLKQMSRVCDQLTISLVCNEAPSDLEIQLDAAGLPKFERIIRTISEAHSQPQQAAEAVVATE